ncbi:MAG: response regulator, partial [Alphaproteobacteria bacterium]
ATVSIYLPRAPDVQAAAPAEDMTAMPRGQGEMILVVEDEDSVRDLAVRLLGNLGYGVMAANDAKSALEIIDGEAPIDLLFTDIVLPGGVSGRDLAVEARQKRPGLAVVYASGYSTAIEADDPIEANAIRLTKPYRGKALAEAFHLALGDQESEGGDGNAG